MMADGKTDTALGLGERLRSARKARALTLEQAAFTLRIEVPVLRALEDERYAALGAAVFVRGHLKAYAKLLGLSEEAVLAAYRAADPDSDVPPKVTRELEKPLTNAPGPLAIAAVAAALLAMLLLFFLSSGGRPVPAVPPPLQEIVPAEDPAPPVGTVPVPVPVPLPEAAPAPPPVSPAVLPAVPPVVPPVVPEAALQVPPQAAPEAAPQ